MRLLGCYGNKTSRGGCGCTADWVATVDGAGAGAATAAAAPGASTAEISGRDCLQRCCRCWSFDTVDDRRPGRRLEHLGPRVVQRREHLCQLPAQQRGHEHTQGCSHVALHH